MPELAKSQRVRRIEHILAANHLARRPALTLRQLAARFDNAEMTIRRDVEELSRDIPLHMERGRVMIDPGWDVPVQPVFLKLEEAAAVFLAARLLARYSDEPNSAVVSALTILADALPHSIAEHVRRTSLLAAAEPDPQFAQVFSAITCGWAERRRVRIRYRRVGSEEVQERIIHPYYIEPGPLGYSLYVIAHSEERDAVRVFKVERILEAELLADQFSLPADFDPLRYLAAAWGVMGPDYVVVLGRSQDLFTYTSISRITVEQADRAYYEHTLLPYDNWSTRVLAGNVAVMPRFVDYNRRREASFGRYLALSSKIVDDPDTIGKQAMLVQRYADSPLPWVDPEVRDRHALARGLVWHSFVEDDYDYQPSELPDLPA